MGGSISYDSEKFKNLPEENQKWIKDCDDFQQKHPALSVARDALSGGYYSRMYFRASQGCDLVQSADECVFDPNLTAPPS